MSIPYERGKDYPFQSGQQYDNLVAYGRWVSSVPRWRGRNGNYYALYYDTYLETVYENNTNVPYFLYRYVYWYAQVTVRSRSIRPVDKTPKIIAPTKVVSIPGVSDQVTVVADKIDGYQAFPASVRLRMTGTGFPGETGLYRTPSNFGWKSVITGNSATPGLPPVVTYSESGTPGSGGVTKSSYWDRNGTTNETRINGGADGGDDPAQDQDPDDDGFQDSPETPAAAEQDPLPAINWFNKPTRWNPPLINIATGAYVAVDLGDRTDTTEPPTRQSILGINKAGERIKAKGYLRQYIVNAEEFRVNGGDTEPAVEDPDWDTDQTMINLENGFNYGFRFHYNPEQVSIGAMNIPNIDPAFLISGKEKAFPAGADGSTVSFPLYLNRIEDVSILRRGSPQALADKFTALYRGNSRKDTRLRSRNPSWIREDIRGIRERGTGYDLEFLYRTAMGRAFPTALRGDTADLGVILGLPMQLKLSKHLNYVGRLTGLSYNHVMFTQDMVPMFTVVNITFSRVPDAQSFSGARS